MKVRLLQRRPPDTHKPQEDCQPAQKAQKHPIGNLKVNLCQYGLQITVASETPLFPRQVSIKLPLLLAVFVNDVMSGESQRLISHLLAVHFVHMHIFVHASTR